MKKYEDITDIFTHLYYCFYDNLKRDDAYIIIDDTYIQSGMLDDCDKIYCIDNDLRGIKLNRPGGTVIFFKGDFAYGHYGDDVQQFTIKWRDFLINKLKEKGLNAVVSNNDILIDNNKITGTTIMREKMALGFVSINPDAELIRKICLKPSDNDFEGLSKYNISAEEVELWFTEFVRRY